MPEFLFQGWDEVARVPVVALLAYIALILFLRVSGKRTLAKLNAFDLVVTVAIGSTLATILLSRDVAVVEGFAAFAALIGLQYAVAWTSVRWSGFARLVRAEATLLVRNGELCHAAMKRERVTEDEIMTVIRQSSASELADVTAVILETEGSFSVIGRSRDGGTVNYSRAALSDPTG